MSTPIKLAPPPTADEQNRLASVAILRTELERAEAGQVCAVIVITKDVDGLWTHHTTGVQMIRACAMIQTLLGNIGRPGGGIMALRGHCSIQGSTDIPTLYNMLPGYLTQPSARKPHKTLDEYLQVEAPPTGWWTKPANSPIT